MDDNGARGLLLGNGVRDRVKAIMRRERYDNDGISYEICVYDDEGGFRAGWKCLACGRSGGPPYGVPTTAEAIGRAQGQFLDEHLTQMHGTRA